MRRCVACVFLTLSLLPLWGQGIKRSVPRSQDQTVSGGIYKEKVTINIENEFRKGWTIGAGYNLMKSSNPYSSGSFDVRVGYQLNHWYFGAICNYGHHYNEISWENHDNPDDRFREDTEFFDLSKNYVQVGPSFGAEIKYFFLKNRINPYVGLSFGYGPFSVKYSERLQTSVNDGWSVDYYGNNSAGWIRGEAGVRFFPFKKLSVHIGVLYNNYDIFNSASTEVRLSSSRYFEEWRYRMPSAPGLSFGISYIFDTVTK